MNAKLGPEIALVPKMERVRYSVIGLLQSYNSDPANIVGTLKLTSTSGSKGSRADTNFTHLPDDVCEDVLNRAQRSAREFECPFDLEAMGRS